ncbi:MAG TPA: SprT-like domain-containing protein [Gemmatimonadaceae bacterium]|nr:SprT-like domain-containing protein [Gemmatimonadaceae bacterium]
MLHALTRLFGRARHDPSQLAFDLDAPAPTAEALLAKLRALGLRRIATIRLTRNRAVMVSYRGTELRVHEAYLAAGETVLRAIVTFLEGRTRAERRAAQRLILAHDVPVVPRRGTPRERTAAADLPLANRLAEAHRELNDRYFGGQLREVPIRVSRRMRSRLGHYTAATAAGDPAEIAISRSHVRRHGWEEAVHTLLHEMVHQWQDETGHVIDHGRTFRAKAREVGIEASARRLVCAPQPRIARSA